MLLLNFHWPFKPARPAQLQLESTLQDSFTALMKFLYFVSFCAAIVRGFRSKTHEAPLVRGIDGQVDERVVIEFSDDDPTDGYIYL